jgi:hypothetical protein
VKIGITLVHAGGRGLTAAVAMVSSVLVLGVMVAGLESAVNTCARAHFVPVRRR